MPENRLHFYTWAVMPAPLILSFDARTLAQEHPDCLAMVLNPEVCLRLSCRAPVRHSHSVTTVEYPSSPRSPFLAVSGRPTAAPHCGAGCFWQVIAINQDSLVRGARVLRQGGGVATPSITYQVGIPR